MLDHWSIASGEDLFSSVRGVSYDKSAASERPGKGMVPILRANNISSDGRIITDDLVYVPGRYVSSQQYLKDGDLLIAASSGSRSVVGKAAPASSEHSRFAFGAFCTVARPRRKEFGLWLSSYMKSRAYRTFVESVALGININNLRSSDLKAMPIWIAPLPEQQRIAATINSLSAKSSRARENLDHVPRLVEKYKRAILTAAFLGELTRDWRKKHPSSETGDQLRLRLTKEKQQWMQEAGLVTKSSKSGFSQNIELPAIPASWTWLSVDELSTKVADGVHKKPTYVDNGIPFLTLKNLTAEPGMISFANCKFVTKSDHGEFIKRTHPETGDILITKDGTLGVVRAIRTNVEFSIFVSLALVKPVNRRMTDYLELAFQSPIVQDHDWCWIGLTAHPSS